MSTRMHASAIDCLHDFGRNVNLIQGVSLLAEFTGVTPATALGWFGLAKGDRAQEDKGLPKGPTLVRLRCFLELVGYEVVELRELPEPASKLAWSVALSVVTVEEARSYLEYGENNSQAILTQLLRPVSGLPEERVRKLRELVEAHAEARRARMNEWRQRVQELDLGSAMPEVPRAGAHSADVDLPSSTAGIILVNSLQVAALVLGRLQEVDSSQRATILAMVARMIGPENLAIIRTWVNTEV